MCPGCSTGCNIFVDHRDGEVHRLRPRRNVEVNKSWMCDIGRAGVQGDRARDARARARRAGCNGGAAWQAGDRSAAGARRWSRGACSEAGARLAPSWPRPQATNEDLFAFRALADKVGRHARLPRRQPPGQPQVREDDVLLRADRNPNTRAAWTWAWAATGMDAILAACRAGQGEGAACCRGPSCCGCPSAADALAARPVHRRDGDPRRPGAGARARRAARRGVGRGGRHLHELPAPGAAHPPRGARARATRCRAGSWPPRCSRGSARPWPPRRRARCSRCSPRRCPDYAGLDYRAVGADGRVLPAGAGPGARRRRGPDGAPASSPSTATPKAGRGARSCSGWPSRSRTWSRRCSAGRPPPSSSPSRSATPPAATAASTS